ncbi:MAG TPA: sensor histidine kinase [Candidatus Elarobacter sp.]|jgi:signal transduction histidine kinase|nr:sensor histidine kinase [Candidatus Elarobacter sp.]
MLERLRSDPLRGLIALEWSAMVSSYAFDVSVAVGHVIVNSDGGDARSIAVFTCLFVVTVAAVFSSPHRAHRRYAALLAAVLGLAGLGLLPTSVTATPVLILIFVARLTFAFGFRGTAFAWCVAVATVILGCVPTLVQKPTSGNVIQLLVAVLEWTLIFTLLFGLVGIMWLYARKAAAAAAASERSRIALDLHDSLGHAVTTLSVHLQNAIQLHDIDAEKTRSYLDRASALAREVLDDVRETVTILHDEPATQPLAVSELLERLRDDFSVVHSLSLRWNVCLTSEPQGRAAIALYRVLQEALTNVARHAGARNVTVDINGDCKKIDLTVVDDGSGFRAGAPSGHGLTSMRSRVESLNGAFRVDSAVDLGTTLRATFPMESTS